MAPDDDFLGELEQLAVQAGPSAEDRRADVGAEARALQQEVARAQEELAGLLEVARDAGAEVEATRNRAYRETQTLLDELFGRTRSELGELDAVVEKLHRMLEGQQVERTWSVASLPVVGAAVLVGVVVGYGLASLG
tara:strand:+ start:293 stop:703 length:411 start_codon:yes stop_codon:yes gene_type:complete